jgi:hypothetical protein
MIFSEFFTKLYKMKTLYGTPMSLCRNETVCGASMTHSVLKSTLNIFWTNLFCCFTGQL